MIVDYSPENICKQTTLYPYLSQFPLSMHHINNLDRTDFVSHLLTF